MTGASAPDDLPAETPDTVGAFPRLTAAQLQTLSRAGRTIPVSAGQVLAQAGESHVSFFAVIAGRLGVYEGELSVQAERDTPRGRTSEPGAVDGKDVEIHGAGRFLGDIGLLEGQPSFATIVALVPGETLEVSLAELENVVTRDPLLGDVILRAYLIRRSMAIGFGAGLRVIGSPFSPDTRQLLDFAARNRVPHRLIDVERDPGAEAILRRLGLGASDVPVVIVAGSASHVHLIVRGSDLSASMSRYLIVQVVNHPRITVHLQTVIVDANGTTDLESLTVEHSPSGERAELRATRLFVFIGSTPATSWLGPEFATDERGYLITGIDPTGIAESRRALETSVAGVFAVGDVRSQSVKRISAAIGEGATVVRMVHEHLATGGCRR